MSTENSINQLTIKGFKSIRKLNQFRLDRLNVLIGANGVGKSNFVSYFRMLSEMMELRLQKWTINQGSSDRIVSFGVQETNKLESLIEFGLNGYKFELEPTEDGGFSFSSEEFFFNGALYEKKRITLGSGHTEAKLKEAVKSIDKSSRVDYCYNSIASWKIFHFHDVSETAGVKRWGAIQDNESLRSNGSNLAAYLYRLSKEFPKDFEQIRKITRLAIPLFDDFVLKPRKLKTGEEQIRLLWKQKDSDYSLWPSQLSDGSIRFICLVTALHQPIPPTTIIIDEPELGLHSHALTLLGSLLRSASTRMQVILSTQSIALVNQFTVDDLIIVERDSSGTVFKRFKEGNFKTWLEDYSVGDLWEKNIIGGRPRK